MTLDDTNTRPPLTGAARRQEARTRRVETVKLSEHRPSWAPGSNKEEITYPSSQPTNFTKGLLHDEFGLASRADYERFVRAIVKPDIALTDLHIAAEDPDPGKYRRWESPLAGHSFENQGPDPDAVAMAPAPKLGRSELCAEMATLYAMALVRDLSFAALSDPATEIGYEYPSNHPQAGKRATVGDLIGELEKLSWYNFAATPTGYYGKQLTRHETRRRAAAWDDNNKLTAKTLFRGSTKGAKTGPYISQFMLLGAKDKLLDGLIPFGAQTIDQSVIQADPGIDFMTDWQGWLNIQNGHAAGAVGTAGKRRITSPRDLATFVHIDQLYQAYFNACLILLENWKTADADDRIDNGTPIKRQRGRSADGFATWGGPHILSLLTEVASRGLRAVRRQKFQIHRRARPEVMAARLTQVANNATGGMDNAAIQALKSMLKELGEGNPADPSRPGVLLLWIAEHNAKQNRKDPSRKASDKTVIKNDLKNFLLPMAFPEGSPMHPAYGAGHATVAGACVTILKAFFESETRLDEVFPQMREFQRMKDDGSDLEPDGALGSQTIAQELDKLAANISIGRNIAGVHYYSDYYDSLRLGERIAAGILEEQMLDYPEEVQLSFIGFDGDAIIIRTNGGSSEAAVDFLVNGNPHPDARQEWWLRHVVEYGTSLLEVASGSTFDETAA